MYILKQMMGHIVVPIRFAALVSFAMPKWGMFLGVWFCLLPQILDTNPAVAKSTDLDPSRTALCYNAISVASQTMGVPQDVMLAISLTETGKKIGGRINPWPWTVNMEGKGVWFKDRNSALSYVQQRYNQGARSFDVGCFQINYRWHHQHFRTIEEMFDPIINATYAAKFLRDLYSETGSWEAAAGYFHSRTPEFANRYRERFSRYRERIASNNFDLPVYAGHGSEALSVSADGRSTSSIRAYAPVLQLGLSEAPKSTFTSSQGSLFQTQNQSRSLLRRSNKSLF